MSKETRYLSLAEKVAKLSTFKFRHGSVLVKGGSVISIGNNSEGFNRFAHLSREDRSAMKASLHAEIDCLLGLDPSKTKGSTLYVCRVNNKNNIRMSKPCPMCQKAAQKMGIKKIVYTTDIGFDTLIF